jgi:hypothetical protein
MATRWGPDSVSASISLLCRRLKLPPGASLTPCGIPTRRICWWAACRCKSCPSASATHRCGHGEVYAHSLRGQDDEAVCKLEEFQRASRLAAGIQQVGRVQCGTVLGVGARIRVAGGRGRSARVLSDPQRDVRNAAICPMLYCSWTHLADFVPRFVAFETNVRPYADLDVVAMFLSSYMMLVFAKECRWVLYNSELCPGWTALSQRRR